MKKVICKVCGKTYSDKPEVCEYDGLSDFDEISDTTKNQSFLAISSDEILTELPLSDLPIDLAKAGISGTISFPFKPAGVRFPIKMPFSVIFSESDFIISDSEKEASLKISIRKDALKTDIRLRKKNEEFDRTLITDAKPDNDYYEFDLLLNDTLFLNGLFFKHIKR